MVSPYPIHGGIIDVSSYVDEDTLGKRKYVADQKLSKYIFCLPFVYICEEWISVYIRVCPSLPVVCV